MRKAPESQEIDNPMLAGRVKGSNQESNYKVPQDVMLEKKHQRQLDEAGELAEKARLQQRPQTSSDYVDDLTYNKSKLSSPFLNRDSSTDNYRSKERLEKNKSNEDLSMSSHSKTVTQKRQWKAP